MGMPASSAEVDAILLFGGDGTVHRHLSQLVKLGLPVLVVPAGSGNDFARALGLRNTRDSLAAWLRFCSGITTPRKIDLGVIAQVDQTRRSNPPLTARYFSCVAGVGFDAEVVRRANGWPRWLRGHGGYALSVAPTIFTFAPLPMKITTPAENRDSENGGDDNWATRSDQPTILAAFANTPVYGGGMKIAPRAQIDDGLLDVCIVGDVSPFKLFCMFPTVYSGQHLKLREVNYFSTARARIETEHPVDVYADGEFVCRTPVEIGIQPAALRVITP
jgi:diacylglycerol kinase (ATP)